MSHTNRSSTRGSAVPAPSAGFAPVSMTPPSRVEALRRLVAAGQYHVSPRWLATRMFRAAGVKVPE
jgi:anti-sigma28 factor (negative regulator of flagellin synthesis)